MEAEVTSMASGGSSSQQMHCVTCGLSSRWTPRWWECDVCWDYILCENCHNGSEILSAGPLVHNQDHHMSPHETNSSCDGCKSDPIWNLQWRCKVCPDMDLCEACHGGLDAADMPLEHLKEHPMVAIEVICSDMLIRLQPSFTKPMDPQWSFIVRDKISRGCGFMWKKRKPMSRLLSGMDDAIISLRGNAIEDNSISISKLKEQSTLSSSSLFTKQAREATQTHGMLDKKHKVFLSHAGTEKDFVEQLYRDLLRVHHFGIFFDKEDDSLPKGEPFPKRIFDAAKHCELAIVVISHEYFTHKWPMLELVAFVEAQKTRPELKILPIFYKLTVKQFKEQLHEFEKCWNEKVLVSKDEVDGWKEALKVISRTNGLEYDKKIGEPMFRDRIVEAVSKRVKAELMWDDSHVQGISRMQETIKEMIRSSGNASREVLLVSTLRMGLYGMGGSGKTTMCKVWRNQMMPYFLGKVHHMEFGSVDVLQMRMKLLQSICELDDGLLQSVDEGQALTLLKIHIPKQRVCLLIDNVSHNKSCIQEARELLNLPFKEESLIMVTSRSSSILETLKIESKLTMRIPSLSTVEAKALFSHHAGCTTSSLTKEQMKAMESFVERCNFPVQGLRFKEYHPLALQVLGSQVGPNAARWQKIKIDFKYYEGENIHPLFSILRSSFDTLDSTFRTIFLDIALDCRGNCNVRMPGLKRHLQYLHDEVDEQFSLSVVEVLQGKSLIDVGNVEPDDIYVHDLYREFARMEVEKNGVLHSAGCFLSGGRKRHRDQERRVRIHDDRISHITGAKSPCPVCMEAELFILEGCANLVNVDVPRMESLMMFDVRGGCPQLISVNFEGSPNLRSFYWTDFEGKVYPNFTSMESLEELTLKNGDAQPHETRYGCLDFSKNSKLEKLWLSYLPVDMLNLNQAVLLKRLILENCDHLERVDGLEAMVQLKELVLINCQRLESLGGLEALVHLKVVLLLACSSLVEFPSLSNFPLLEVFGLEGAAKLKQIEGFANLIALCKLSLSGGVELEELPGIEACTRLSHLWLNGTSIRDCSWISTMKDLTIIDLCDTKIRSVPDCCSLSMLSEIWLDDCRALNSIGENVGLIPHAFPQSLQKFSARNCQSLNALPEFHDGSTLRFLNIYKTCVEDVSSIRYCKELQKLYCSQTQISSLSNLSGLTRLEVLDVHGCKLLTRMDNIKSLPALEQLEVCSCCNLLALPDLRSSTRLMKLTLYGCPLVDPNAVELPCASSVGMDIEDVVDNQLYSEPEYATSRVRDIHELGDEEETPLHSGPPEIEKQKMKVLDPRSGHDIWRFATLNNLVAMIASWCGGFGAD